MNCPASKPKCPPNEELISFRTKIDELDQKLVALLDQRADLVLQIGDWKQQNGWPIFDSVREAKILQKVTTQKRQHLSDEHIQKLFQYMITFFRKLEANQRKHNRQ